MEYRNFMHFLPVYRAAATLRLRLFRLRGERASDFTCAAPGIASNSLSAPFKELTSKTYARAKSAGLHIRIVGLKRLVDAVRFDVRAGCEIGVAVGGRSTSCERR
ncbi:hypothetical protein [Paraburkholderia phenazinium]|jgi:hypothetical protein|nr:hypothetical protein [Paraburkholderia phenazinium]